LKIEVEQLSEPRLEFGNGEAVAPKPGLLTCGPYSLQLGAAHPAAVRLGLVGPPPTLKAARGFITRLDGSVASAKANQQLFPDFPGFNAALHADLINDPVLDAPLKVAELESALTANGDNAFHRVLDLYRQGVRHLTERDVRPDVIVCCLPAEVVQRCHHIEAKPLTAAERRFRQQEEERRRKGIYSLFDLDIDGARIEQTAVPSPDDLLRRDFRRVLKAFAMEVRVPIQLLTPKTFEEGARGQEDPATRAWNLAVGIFYKAGGIPWRIKPQVEHTCFVGISFHHLRTKGAHVVYASLAQAFSTEGDGFALRGEAMPWNERDREVHLSAEQMTNLLDRVLDAYRDRAGRDPLRVVVHKTSAFSPEELAGAQTALTDIPEREVVTLRSGDFRVVRHGSYPPHRGSLFGVGDASYLFTTGFVPWLNTYPGPHIPAPLELVGVEGDPYVSANEILALTKMNWNSAAATAAFPITLRFAKEVGAIMSEVPPDRTPHPAYRFYM
jgi:hypothetical protein